MQPRQSKEIIVIEHIKKFMAVVHPGESMHKVFELYGIDWTLGLANKLDMKTWVYLWDKLCTTEQKRVDAWIVMLADKEVESIETTK